MTKDAEEPRQPVYLVQRWWSIRALRPDGRVRSQGYTENRAFTDDLVGAVGYYRRSLDGAWVDPTWEDWGVAADPLVVETADAEPPSIPMPDHIREAMTKFAARLQEVPL